MERVGEVTDEERRFSFDVEEQTPTKPEGREAEDVLLSKIQHVHQT